MGLIIQQRALQAASELRQVLAVVRKRDRALFDQIHRAMNSVVLNIAEAEGNDPGTAKARFVGVRVGEGSPRRASACGRLRLPREREGRRGRHRARPSLRDVLEAFGALGAFRAAAEAPARPPGP